ncbi:MAG: hypothetical protein D6735_13555, partial [Acidobacteria bacterium]
PSPSRAAQATGRAAESAEPSPSRAAQATRRAAESAEPSPSRAAQATEKGAKKTIVHGKTDSGSAVSLSEEARLGNYIMVPLDLISPDYSQPRQIVDAKTALSLEYNKDKIFDLILNSEDYKVIREYIVTMAQNILEIGLLNPITLVEDYSEGETKTYTIVAGEIRYWAYYYLNKNNYKGYETIPAHIIQSAGLDHNKIRTIQWSENIKRHEVPVIQIMVLIDLAISTLGFNKEKRGAIDYEAVRETIASEYKLNLGVKTVTMYYEAYRKLNKSLISRILSNHLTYRDIRKLAAYPLQEQPRALEFMLKGESLPMTTTARRRNRRTNAKTFVKKVTQFYDYMNKVKIGFRKNPFSKDDLFYQEINTIIANLNNILELIQRERQIE